VVAGPAQRGPDVVAVAVQPVQPQPQVRAGEAVLGTFRELQHEAGVPDGGDAGPVAEMLGGILAHDLEEPVTLLGAVGAGLHERLVDEPAEQLQGVQHTGVVTGHGRRGGEGESAAEDRQPREQVTLGGGQQVVAPVEGGAQRGLPRRDVAAGGHQQRHRVVEPRDDPGQRQDPQPRRGELQRERHAVQPAAEPGEVGGVGVGHCEVGQHQPGPVGEQLHRLAAGQVRGPRRGQIGRYGQALQPPRGLPRRSQRLPAGREDPQRRAGPQQLADQGRAFRDEVLAVVQHQQAVPVAQLPDDHLRQRLAGHLDHPHRVGERGQQQGRPVELGERHPPGGLPTGRGEPVADRARQPGLAASARADQAQQPGPVHRGQQGGDLGLAPDEAGQR
jgi:hypothetical protein